MMPTTKGILLVLCLFSVYCFACCSAFCPRMLPALMSSRDASGVLFAAKGAKKKKNKSTTGAGFGSSRTATKPKQRVDSETAMLTALYQEQYEKQQHANASPRRLVQVSHSPLIFTVDEFIDPEACARVQPNGAGCFDLDFPGQLSDHLFNGQESEMDGLLFNHASSDDRNHASSRDARSGASHPFPDGLHMDTNGQCLFRHVTAILYLNDVPDECGGATVFPLARALPNDPALAASRRLLVERISHTRSRACQVAGLEADANMLEARGVGTHFDKDSRTETAIRIQPKAGRLLIFFSRYYNGEEDPRTWHAGERLIAGTDALSGAPVATEKRILTLFKQVDYSTVLEPSLTETTFEAFLAPQISAQQKWLQAQL